MRFFSYSYHNRAKKRKNAKESSESNWLMGAMPTLQLPLKPQNGQDYVQKTKR